MFGLVGLAMDINGDGQVDSQFYSASYVPASYYATGASGVGSAQLLVTPNAGLDEGSHLVALGPGFLIGGTIDESLLWAGQDAPSSYGDATVLGSYFPSRCQFSLLTLPVRVGKGSPCRASCASRIAIILIW